MHMPDNESDLDTYVAESERWDRRHRHREIEEEMEFVTVPDDYGTHKGCYPNKED